MINSSYALIYSNRLPVHYSAVIICPINLVNVKYPLNFSSRTYFDDMRVPRVTLTTGIIDMIIPIPVTLYG